MNIIAVPWTVLLLLPAAIPVPVRAAAPCDSASLDCHWMPTSRAKSVVLAQASSDSSLRSVISDWLTTSDRIKGTGALIVGRPLPIELTAARTAFEQSWLNTGLRERREVPQADLRRALAAVVRSYRFQETGNPDPKLAMFWADQMIAYYDQVANKHDLAEAMLEKAANFLQISQLNHTDRNRFDQISRDGDKLLQDCMTVADDDQRVEVLRYWSRFYYNLARPVSGRLSDRWDDRFLQLADQRIDQALVLQPDALKNLNQKARVTQRRAKATLSAPSAYWSGQLWSVQQRFAAAWSKLESSINRAEDRLSPLNVLAMVTLDAVAYSIVVSDSAGKSRLAPDWLRAIDGVALPAQLNAWGLVRNTELSRSYGFDTVYDLARLYALRGVVTGLLGTGHQNEDIDLATQYFREARSLATVLQLDGAKAELNGDPVLDGLPDFARTRFARALDGVNN